MKGLPKIDGEEMQNINRIKWEVDIHNFLWIFLLSLVIRVWLIHKFPVIYDWDGYNRLVHNGSFFVGHWLPLLQSFIVILSKVSSDPVFIRYMIVIIAGFTCWSCYLFVSTLFNRRVGMIAAVMLSLNSIFLMWSIVPYQEALFLFFLFLGLYFWERGISKTDIYFASLLLGFACLTRYEGWFILPLLFVRSGFEEKEFRSWKLLSKKMGRSILYLGWAPLLWTIYKMISTISAGKLIYFRPLSQKVTFAYALESIPKLWTLLLTYETPAIFCLSLLGILFVIFSKHRKTNSYIYIFIFVNLGALIFRSASNNYTFTNRMLVIPVAFLLIYAAFGLDNLLSLLFRIVPLNNKKVKRITFLRTAASFLPLVFLCYLPLMAGTRLVKGSNDAYYFKEPYLAAKWIDEHLEFNDRIIVLANRPYGYYPIAVYSKLRRENIYSYDRFKDMKEPEIWDFIKDKSVKCIVVLPHESWVLDRLIMNKFKNTELIKVSKLTSIYQFSKVHFRKGAK